MRILLQIMDTDGYNLDSLKEEFEKKWESVPPAENNIYEVYELVELLGCGSFGRVHLIRKKETNEYHAVKEINKNETIKRKQVTHVFTEKRVLYSMQLPFVVNLLASYKDFHNVYLILPFLQGGELFHYHRRMQKFTEKHARFYAGQIFLALEYMHYMQLVYRDLKPENILLDRTGYIKLTDFGFTKRVETRTMTVCGTPEYMAPEIIMGKPYSTSVDWWAYGVLLFEFINGTTPFVSRSHDEMDMFRRICNGDYQMPRNFTPDLKSLINSLLEVDMTKRLGSLLLGNNRIKSHPWFADLDWLALQKQRVPSPYVPRLINDRDLSQFKKVKNKFHKIDRFHKIILDPFEEF